MKMKSSTDNLDAWAKWRVHCTICILKFSRTQENIYISGTGVPRVVNFGTGSYNLEDTMRWMAPEAFEGKYSIGTDVWSFGMTVYVCICLSSENPYIDANIVVGDLDGRYTVFPSTDRMDFRRTHPRLRFARIFWTEVALYSQWSFDETLQKLLGSFRCPTQYANHHRKFEVWIE